MGVSPSPGQPPDLSAAAARRLAAQNHGPRCADRSAASTRRQHAPRARSSAGWRRRSPPPRQVGQPQPEPHRSNTRRAARSIGERPRADRTNMGELPPDIVIRGFSRAISAGPARHDRQRSGRRGRRAARDRRVDPVRPGAHGAGEKSLGIRPPEWSRSRPTSWTAARRWPSPSFRRQFPRPPERRGRSGG